MSLRDPYFRELFEAGLVWEKRGIINVVKASCKKCGLTHEMNLATHLPTDQIIKKVRVLGWHDKRKAWTCDKCINHEDVVMVADARPPLSDDIARIFSPVSTAETPPLPVSDSAVRPTYRQIKKAMALIELNFDAENGAWLEGWSDARLADEVGIQRNAAFLMREDAFGPLKRPKELDQLLGDIKAASEMIADIMARTTALAARFRMEDV